MRLFLPLLIGLLLHLSCAQVFGNRFETGSYVLSERYAVRQPGCKLPPKVSQCLTESKLRKVYLPEPA